MEVATRGAKTKKRSSTTITDEVKLRSLLNTEIPLPHIKKKIVNAMIRMTEKKLSINETFIRDNVCEKSLNKDIIQE